MRRFPVFYRFLLSLLSLASASGIFWVGGIQTAYAAASLYVSSPSSATVGDTFSISVYVNTGGQSANAFEGTVSYSSALLQGVRGSYSGSVCSLPVTQPDPGGGSATFSCGSPSGFNGTGLVATIFFTATNNGSASFGLSGCSVLANDGRGTDITGGCSGNSTTINGVAPPPTPTPAPPTAAPTPTPPPAVVSTPTPAPQNTSSVSVNKSTPKPTASSKATPGATSVPTPTPSSAPTPTPLNNQAAQPAEVPKAAPSSAATPSAPPAKPLPTEAPATAAPETTTATEKRTVSSAFKDLFSSFSELKTIRKDVPALIALLLSILPILIITIAFFFLLLRLLSLSRQRKFALDRLFEMELSELAALEGKMDLLSEKGGKGKDQYRDEFRKAKENILRQIRPDYGKPMASQEAPETPKETPSS